MITNFNQDLYNFNELPKIIVKDIKRVDSLKDYQRNDVKTPSFLSKLSNKNIGNSSCNLLSNLLTDNDKYKKLDIKVINLSRLDLKFLTIRGNKKKKSYSLHNKDIITHPNHIDKSKSSIFKIKDKEKQLFLTKISKNLKFTNSESSTNPSFELFSINKKLNSYKENNMTSINFNPSKLHKLKYNASNNILAEARARLSFKSINFTEAKTTPKYCPNESGQFCLTQVDLKKKIKSKKRWEEQ